MWLDRLELKDDQKKLLKQFGYLAIISIILASLFAYQIEDTSFGSILFATAIFSLLFYPILFLASWVKEPPESLFVKAFIHLITLPAIIYYIILSLFLVQYLFASFSLDSLVSTFAVIGISIYLIYTYTKFVKSGA